MANAFDSRALNYTDAYGQRFMREGTYRYMVAPAMTGDIQRDWPFLVEVVQGRQKEMSQHTVMLDHEDGTFQPQEGEPHLQIEVGDLVTWVCRQTHAPAFEVIGEKEFFSSARLTNESGYAHAFGIAGDYEWVDTYGSGLEGVVRVVDPRLETRRDLARWREELSVGALVMVSGTQAEPAEIEIMTGQTVYFAVTESPGISVTDRRLAEVTRVPAFQFDQQGQQAAR